MGADVASGTPSKGVALGVRVPPPMPAARLIVEWPDGGRIEHPLSAEGRTVGGKTPCQYVAVLGQIVTPGRCRAAWWIEP